MEREIIATFRAATAKPDYLTTEKFDAMLGGWGVFNLGVWAAADVIAKEIKKGKKLKLEVTNEAYTDVDEIAKKSVKKLMECGADPANAALVSAALLYWAGVNVQCGIPCPNRKLGAVTRMAAGIPSGRVSSMPTEKLNNKVSGYAATHAIYHALEKEHLAPYDSQLLPLGIGGSPFVGHTAIGEDHLFPKLGQKLAKIGTRAMLKAYESAGMKPCRWMSALFGAAAALEIIHPDAYVGEEYGQFLIARTPGVVATAAVEEAGLPEVVHIRVTNEELNMARLVGDVALILKDSGTPTVVGMIMFNEIFSLIKEGAAVGFGRAGGPLLLPLNHWVSAPSLALYLLGKGATEDEIVSIVRESMNGFFQNEDAAVATNILARRAEFIERGPLTGAIIRATEPVMTNSVSKRAAHAYKEMKSGKTLPEVLEGVQKKHVEAIAAAVSAAMSKTLNKKIEYIKFKAVRPGAGRRTHKFAQRHFAFDAYIDVEVKVDGKVYEWENLLAKAAPEALLNGDKETMDALAAVGMAVTELLNSGACSMDVVVPACMAAAMGTDPKEAAETAAETANVIIAMPSVSLKKATQLASDIMKGLDS